MIRDKKFNIGSFAVSVNESIDELITVLNIPYKRIKGIAKGQMTSEFGVADFKEGSTHHKQYDHMVRKVRSTLFYNNVEYPIQTDVILVCSGTRPDRRIFQYSSLSVPELLS